MSWLSEAWRKLKGGRSDAQTVASIFALGMTGQQKKETQDKLIVVLYAIQKAATVSSDKRIDEAREWVMGGIDILGE